MVLRTEFQTRPKTMNPIYIEYYPHENAQCYKINLPWTKYRKYIRVLCRVDEGIDLAMQRAREAIAEHLEESFLVPVSQNT